MHNGIVVAAGLVGWLALWMTWVTCVTWSGWLGCGLTLNWMAWWLGGLVGCWLLGRDGLGGGLWDFEFELDGLGGLGGFG